MDYRNEKLSKDYRKVSDNDGDLDLAFANQQSVAQIYNNQQGAFFLDWESNTPLSARSLAWGDYNKDGYIDLAIGTSDGLYLFENDFGSFGVSNPNTLPHSGTNIVWGDYDNDGDLDLATGGFVYRNQAGEFVRIWGQETAAQMGWVYFDSDNLLDLTIGGAIYRNQQSDFSYVTGITVTGKVAWADYDHDGDLDVATSERCTIFVGGIFYDEATCYNKRIYTQNQGVFSPTWTSTDRAEVAMLAWADIDGDGTLDLTSANFPFDYKGTSNLGSLALYTNSNSGDGLPGFRDVFVDRAGAQQAAWGDYDNDGDLDLAVANAVTMYDNGDVELPTTGADVIYRNDKGVLSEVWVEPGEADTRSIGWGDYDNDGDLDVATAGLNEPLRIYQNTTSGFVLSWTAPVAEATHVIAWGDYDNDGDVDIAVGNDGQRSHIYTNTVGEFVLGWSTLEPRATRSAAWGDYDNDGDLDLALGNYEQPSQVYENRGGELALLWSSPETKKTTAVAWADYDADGDLDLTLGNYTQLVQIYAFDQGSFKLAWQSSLVEAPVTSLAWGDYTGDGRLDLATGSADCVSVGGGFPRSIRCSPRHLFRNTGSTLSVDARTVSGDTFGVSWVDVDQDGDNDLTLAQNGSLSINKNLRLTELVAPESALGGSIAPVAGAATASSPASSPIITSLTVPIRYTIRAPFGTRARIVKAFFSPNGGGKWFPAQASTETSTVGLPTNTPLTFTWDVFGSGFFGQTDSMVFRLDIASSAGPFVAAKTSLYSPPFRVRGTQVRVVDEAGRPVGGALVYRLGSGQSRGAAPLSDSAGQPFRTDAQGFLAGRNALAVGQTGDQIVALHPVVVTDTYTLYHTSAPVTERGLSLTQLTTPGVQALTVSSERPLLLFNLDVALEWDARGDAQFMTRLHEDLRRTSEILYDWTNGQVALGEVNVFHDARRLRYEGGWDLWAFANVRVYTSNRIRPNANKGGIVSEPTADPTVAGVEYEPGQIRIGAVWNRYGEAAGTLGEDWPRTLAHELGHYLFALDENYLGLNADGVLVPVEGCRGGMADPYRDDYSEFHPHDEEWMRRCAGTLSQQVNGRSDWESILAFYPQAGLRAPERFDENRGPALLPLATTIITDAPVITPTQTLDVPLFNLEADGERVQPGSGARAFLFRDDLAIDLGRPALDRVEARGAVAGDRLCVFEPAAARLGCEIVSVGDQTLALATRQDWRPELVLTPVTSRTLTVEVTNLPGGLPLTARLYPADYPAGPAAPLSYADGVYRATFGPEVLAEPVFEGLVHIKVDDGSDREAVVDFALGGNPGKRWARTAPRGSPGKRWARTAPVISSDGQVILFTDQEFDEGEFYSFQTVNILPNAPTWVSTVGQAYRLTATAKAPALADASISFSYLQREVPPGQERWLSVYYYDGVTWEKLPRSLSAETNTVSAPLRGPGVYALMTSVEVELRNGGWNYVRYPFAENRPAGEALAGLAGQLQSGEHLIVYADNGPDAPQRWRLYATGVPDYVNSLSQLESDQDYYIWVPRAMTLPIRGTALASVVAQPPATFYGVIDGVEGLSSVSDLPITARIGMLVCGHGTIRLVGDQHIYVVSVEAESTKPGCGAPDRQVSFQVDAQMLAGVGVWNDSRVQALHLHARPTNRNQQLYLPLVRRR